MHTVRRDVREVRCENREWIRLAWVRIQFKVSKQKGILSSGEWLSTVQRAACSMHTKTILSQYKVFYCTFPIYSGLLHAIFYDTNTNGWKTQ